MRKCKYTPQSNVSPSLLRHQPKKKITCLSNFDVNHEQDLILISSNLTKLNYLYLNMITLISSSYKLQLHFIL